MILRMKPRAGIVVADRYELERMIAKGGMGSVWVANHAQLGTKVAVKFMDPEHSSSAEWQSRFEREAKAAATLRSPHVVQILDYGTDDDTPYIVMELLEGEDLKRRLKREGRLSLHEASDILHGACKALRLAADAKIVHRDLKPGNIFLERVGDEEVVKILDFGVAKRTGSIPIKSGTDTESGKLLGSPHYMSPEQARGQREIDHRSDLWSMAVILYIMITGEKPFQGTELGDVIVKICTEEAPPPSSLLASLAPAVDQFFKRALCPDPDGRFQSARALASEFAAIVGEPIPSSTGTHSQPSGRRILTSDTDSMLRPVRPSIPRRDTPQTLAAATLRPAKGSKKQRWMIAVGALLLGGVAALAVAWGDGSEGTAPASAPSTSHAAGTVSEEPPPAPAPEPPAPTRSATSAASSAAPSASGSSPTTATPRAGVPRPFPPPQLPPPKVVPKTSPPTKVKDPVLGF